MGRIVTRSQRRKVRYTEIPVKLKILKLFIKELGNITEGEETNGVEEDTVAVHAEKADDEGWESEEDEEWDDVGEDMSSDLQEMETQEDILQGVNTKVSRSLIHLMLGIHCRFLKEGGTDWREVGVDRFRDRHFEGNACHMMTASNDKTCALWGEVTLVCDIF